MAQVERLLELHPLEILASVGPNEVVKIFQAEVDLVPSENQARKAPSPSLGELVSVYSYPLVLA